MAVPNQRILTIHSSNTIPYVTIGISQWQEAYKNLRYVNESKLLDKPKSNVRSASFALYLYLASNKDGYRLELSPKAIENALGIKEETYGRAYRELVALGYIYKDAYGKLNFALIPNKRQEVEIQNWEEEANSNLKDKDRKNETNSDSPSNPSLNREILYINNRNNTLTNNINNNENITLTTNNSKDNEGIVSLSKSDFSHLDDVGCDGSFDGTWFDQIIPCFWGLPREKKISEIVDKTRFDKEDATFIVDKILDNYENEYDRNNPYAYLYEEVSPFGFHNGKYFDEEIDGFWFMNNSDRMYGITSNTKYTLAEADFIVNHILNYDLVSRMCYFRDVRDKKQGDQNG